MVDREQPAPHTPPRQSGGVPNPLQHHLHARLGHPHRVRRVN